MRLVSSAYILTSDRGIRFSRRIGGSVGLAEGCHAGGREFDVAWGSVLLPHPLLLGVIWDLFYHEGVVSKETVVLRRWGSSIQKFGFINGVDNVNWPPYRDSKS